MTSTSPLMTEPLLPQLEIPMSPLDTVTHGFNPHAVPTLESLPQELVTLEYPPQELTAPIPTLMTDPAFPQLVSPMTPLTTISDRIQPPPMAKPDNWKQMSSREQMRWRQTQKHKNK
jgi:hypothetical protein